MSNGKARVSVVFTKDYAENKKGETLSVSRSLAHAIISQGVAELADKPKKANAKTTVKTEKE